MWRVGDAGDEETDCAEAWDLSEVVDELNVCARAADVTYLTSFAPGFVAAVRMRRLQRADLSAGRLATDWRKA